MKCQSTKKPYESGCEMRALTGEMTGEATAGTGSSETASWAKPALPVSVWKRMKTSGPVDTRGADMSVPEKLPRTGERASGPSYTVTVSQPANRGRRISQGQRQRAGAGGGAVLTGLRAERAGLQCDVREGQLDGVGCGGVDVLAAVEIVAVAVATALCTERTS